MKASSRGIEMQRRRNHLLIFIPALANESAGLMFVITRSMSIPFELFILIFDIVGTWVNPRPGLVGR